MNLKVIVLTVCFAALSACASMQEPKQNSAIEIIYINDQSAPPLGPYSSAVQAGGFVFTSGVIAFDAAKGGFTEANITAQTEQVFDNLESVLATAGVSVNDLVKVTVYLKDPSDMRGMNAVYKERVGANRPARTTVPGADWGRDDILIEIDAIAILPSE